MANPNYYDEENWPWSGLDLEEKTRDLKVVKRAYAKKLKLTRPDDDPDGFRKLRQAFDDAKQRIQWAEYDDEYEEDLDTASEEDIQSQPIEPYESAQETEVLKDKPDELQKPIAEPELSKSVEQEIDLPHETVDEIPNEWSLVWKALEKTAGFLKIPVNEWDEEPETKKKPWGADKPNFDVLVWAEVLDEPTLSRLDYWESISNDLRWQLLRFLGWNYEKPDNHPLKNVPAEFASFLAERFDWWYEDNPHHVITAKQSKFLRRAFRNAGVQMPEPETIKASQFQNQKTKAFSNVPSAKLPFMMRWWFILIAGGLSLYIRSLFS